MNDIVNISYFGTEPPILYAIEEIIIKPNETKLVSLGLKIEIPKGYVGRLFNLHEMLILSNDVGVIDSDYRGDIKCIFYNPTKDSIKISKEKKIARLMIEKHYLIKEQSHLQ
jgi:dUTP pyrophosphatase